MDLHPEKKKHSKEFNFLCLHLMNECESMMKWMNEKLLSALKSTKEESKTYIYRQNLNNYSTFQSFFLSLSTSTQNTQSYQIFTLGILSDQSFLFMGSFKLTSDQRKEKMSIIVMPGTSINDHSMVICQEEGKRKVTLKQKKK